MNTQPTATELVLYVVGALALGYGVVKGMIIGFYPDEAPMVFGALLVGAAALGVGGRLGQKRKAADVEARDRSKGVI